MLWGKGERVGRTAAQRGRFVKLRNGFGTPGRKEMCPALPPLAGFGYPPLTPVYEQEEEVRMQRRSPAAPDGV